MNDERIRAGAREARRKLAAMDGQEFHRLLEGGAMIECTCDGWKRNWVNIKDYMDDFDYQGDPVSHCPWCGETLGRTVHLKLSVPRCPLEKVPKEWRALQLACMHLDLDVTMSMHDD
jgi:hypothetical protein